MRTVKNASLLLLVLVACVVLFREHLPQQQPVSISLERNAKVLKSVFEVFDPSLQPFLSSVPIVVDATADTAKAYPAKGYIGVSPDWDNPVSESRFRVAYEQRGMRPDEPVFMYRFKTDLLIHEFLHILQIHRGIGSGRIHEAVTGWYLDPRFGKPSSKGMSQAEARTGGQAGAIAGNRTKYVLWQALYNSSKLSDVPGDESWKRMQYSERYRSAEKGVEEFAYIGQEILAAGSSSASYIKSGHWSDGDWQDKRQRLTELAPEVLALFQGVFHPALMPR